MSRPEILATRPDLLEALLQSCWLVESARASVFEGWGEGFAEQAERTRRRAGMVAEALAVRGIDVPAALLADHAAWMRSVVGAHPEEVPLGPALLVRLGEWNNVFAAPYLSGDVAQFLALGEAELVVSVAPQPMTRDQALLACPEPGPPPRFVVLTDLHIGAPGTDHLARRAVDEINALEPDFVVVPGDITDDGEPEQFALAREILSGLRVPWYGVLGNHDAVRRSTGVPEGASLYAEHFGEKPADRILSCGGVQVALVDSTDPTPSPFPDWDLARGGFREDAGGTNGGALDPGQAEALASALDPGEPALVVLHHELQPFTAFPPVMFALRTPDSAALAAALRGHRLVGIVAGHTHRSALSVVEGGIPQLEVPALKDWPFCYTVVSCGGGRVRAVVRQVGDPGLVWERSQRLLPIYLRYVTGPQARLEAVL